jgi:HPt (histidine-containing phosphotransfer) domain-containing protein
MDGYISKPIQARQLWEVMALILENNPAKEDARGGHVMGLVLDRAAILARVEGDEELLKEIIELFREDCPRLLQEIREAITQRDAKRLYQAAHTLKGSISNFGNSRSSEAALELETLGRAGDLTQAAAVCKVLQESLAEFLPALSQLLPEPASR